jgi:hypothetical protein
VPQGPMVQAPTVAGVSTAGLDEKDAALLGASYDADVAAIEAALEAGGSVLARDLNRRSALHFCAGNGLVTIVKRLAAAGAELDAQDVLGLTPLHMATGYKKAGTVACLVELGADANVACYGGELPVELAERLLAGTPEKKFLRRNAEWTTLREIVECLDEATEEEEDDDDDDERDEHVKEGLPEGKAAGALQPGMQEVSEADGARFVVRVKAKKPGAVETETPGPPSVPADATFSVRKRESTAADATAPAAPPVANDVKVVVRRPGER